MAFLIAFSEEPVCYPYDDPKTPAATGSLIIGTARQGFLASLHNWSKSDYERQWRYALGRIMRGERKSALVTEYVSPDFASHLEWWPLYLAGDTVLVQNQLLFYDQLPAPFSLENMYEFIHERVTVSDRGRSISEWRVDFSEVKDFFESLETSSSKQAPNTPRTLT